MTGLCSNAQAQAGAVAVAKNTKAGLGQAAEAGQQAGAKLGQAALDASAIAQDKAGEVRPAPAHR